MNAKLKKSDTSWVDPDDAPEITDEWITGADLYQGEKLIRRGRPQGENNKVATNVRYDRDLVEAFKATGSGWQTRMNDALRDWAKAHDLIHR